MQESIGLKGTYYIIAPDVIVSQIMCIMKNKYTCTWCGQEEYSCHETNLHNYYIQYCSVRVVEKSETIVTLVHIIVLDIRIVNRRIIIILK